MTPARRPGCGRPEGGFAHADRRAAAWLRPAGGRRLDLATYQREVDLVRAAVDGRSLDETLPGDAGRGDISLRWIYLHLIGEYARHNGHADLLRERVDGTTGL